MEKTELAGRSGDLGFGEFSEVRWMNMMNMFVFFLWHSYIAWKWIYVGSRPEILEMSRYAAHIWSLWACDWSGFCPNRSGGKVFLWTVVEGVICTNVGDRTGTSTQLTDLIAWFVHVCAIMFAMSSQAHDCRSSYARVKGCEHQLLQMRNAQAFPNSPKLGNSIENTQLLILLSSCQLAEGWSVGGDFFTRPKYVQKTRVVFWNPFWNLQRPTLSASTKTQ